MSKPQFLPQHVSGYMHALGLAHYTSVGWKAFVSVFLDKGDFFKSPIKATNYPGTSSVLYCNVIGQKKFLLPHGCPVHPSL